MRFVDVIARKRDGRALSREEIQFFVSGLIDGTVPDYQASALLMAVVLRGMTDEETSWLTDAMVRSGDRVDLSDLPGIKVGKHSTGGVGDKVSIVLAPVAAACGVIVPKMSGHGLGHTGGTLDKLESIPGFRTDLTVDEFKGVLRRVGACIVGQTSTLAPADKKLYSLRDVTATIESVPLICASIMSKKLAEGSGALVLDVKCGDGAFMKDVAAGHALAAMMVRTGALAGIRTEAFVTDMEAPLGTAVGNAVEIVECIALLTGGGPADLRDLVLRLASRMIVLAGLEREAPDALARATAALQSGAAADVFRRMIEAQGGDPRVVDEPSRLPSTVAREVVVAPRDGYVHKMRAEGIGRASHALGAGRSRVGDVIDPAVGVVLKVRPGERVSAGQPLLELHHRDGRGVPLALSLCQDAIGFVDLRPLPRPLILDEVR